MQTVAGGITFVNWRDVYTVLLTEGLIFLSSPLNSGNKTLKKI